MNTFFQKKHIIITIIILAFLSCREVKDPSKIYSIKKLNIKSIDLVYDKSTLKVPGQKLMFGLAVETTMGEKFTTKGWLGGKLNWLNFKIKSKQAKIFKDKIYFNKNLPYSIKEITLNIKDNKKLGIDTTFTIQLNQITDIKLTPLNLFAKAPGNKINLGIEYTYDNGIKVIETKKHKRTSLFKDFEMYCDGGTFNKNYFLITNNIFNIIEHQVGVVAVYKKDTSLRDTFTVKLDYIDNFQDNYYGFNGSDGFSGMNGSDGSNASCNSCSGGNGSHGRFGEDGSNGYHGPDIELYVDSYFDNVLNTTLIKVRSYNTSSNSSHFFLINPVGSSFIATSTGGSGGDGGVGGHGGDGGDGGDGEEYEIEVEEYETKTDTAGNTYKEKKIKTITKYGQGGNGGHGGDGGYGGNGGIGGNGGNITIIHTDRAAPYLNLIQAYSIEGSGGRYGYGGNGGDGGNGGEGNPSGYSGDNGYKGMNGNYGPNGYQGQVFIEKTNEPIW